jgi:hypothetical protein
MADRILCRIPLIPNYNNASDQEKSKKELSEMGITRFEMFNYVITKECPKSKNTFLEKIKSSGITVFTGKLTY